VRQVQAHRPTFSPLADRSVSDAGASRAVSSACRPGRRAPWCTPHPRVV